MKLKMAARERVWTIKKPTLSAKLWHHNSRVHRQSDFRSFKYEGKERQCGSWHCQQPLEGHREYLWCHPLRVGMGGN